MIILRHVVILTITSLILIGFWMQWNCISFGHVEFAILCNGLILPHPYCYWVGWELKWACSQANYILWEAGQMVVALAECVPSSPELLVFSIKPSLSPKTNGLRKTSCKHSPLIVKGVQLGQWLVRFTEQDRIYLVSWIWTGLVWSPNRIGPILIGLSSIWTGFVNWFYFSP